VLTSYAAWTSLERVGGGDRERRQHRGVVYSDSTRRTVPARVGGGDSLWRQPASFSIAACVLPVPVGRQRQGDVTETEREGGGGGKEEREREGGREGKGKGGREGETKEGREEWRRRESGEMQGKTRERSQIDGSSGSRRTRRE
jgi:hypothetical protein